MNTLFFKEVCFVVCFVSQNIPPLFWLVDLECGEFGREVSFSAIISTIGERSVEVEPLLKFQVFLFKCEDVRLVFWNLKATTINAALDFLVSYNFTVDQ